MLKEGIGDDIYHTHFRNLSDGRWWSPDPLEGKFPWQSPYNSMDGNPILNIDIEGNCTNCELGFSFKFYTFTNEYSISSNLSYGADDILGNFNFAGGLGLTYYSNMYNTGKSGFEFRTSGMLGFDDNNFSLSLGTNNWSGIGQMNEFTQTTGILRYHSGEVGLIYENDGTPMQWLGLGDGNDSYRTMAGQLTIGEFSLNLRMFTGLRNKLSFFVEDEIMKPPTEKKGKFGETYTQDLVTEMGQQYRLGELTINFRGYALGVDSEWVRHLFQNNIAHSGISPQRQFLMINNEWKPVLNLSLNYKEKNKFSIWGN